jgi:hypothetical protein
MNPEASQTTHDRIGAAIRQRLLVAYRTLAYANSGKWSLATWAQLQWVRNTLDGEGLSNMQERREVDPSLQDRSFVRLLHEFVRTASPDQRQMALDAKHDGTAIIEELAAMTPNTAKPTETLKRVVLEIKSSPGLRLFASDFPPLDEIPLPRGDD